MQIRRCLKRNLFVWTLGAWLWQAGCVQLFQNEIEVLLAPEASPTLLRQSLLLDIFGPGLLTFF